MTTRKIILCADDYGLTRPINSAIRDLLQLGRINATSVMVVTPGFDRAEVEALKAVAMPGQIGLHVTLTAPFKPLSPDFAPLRNDAFVPLTDALKTALSRRYRMPALEAEITAQIAAFINALGREPDFVDGHQHVQLFPQVRDAFLRAVANGAPKAWIRQCGRATSLPQRLRDPKGLLLDVLSVAFRRKARRLGIATNPAFAGTYDFHTAQPFARMFPSFLRGLPNGGLIMCHPGMVDTELRRLDTLTTMRERELSYFKSDDFIRALEAGNAALA
jgi:chitin disaccharide deacetylase